jgi:hypothetical protein
MTVTELRQICKARNYKNYAWKRKAELIFQISELDNTCICCDDELTVDEMDSYLKNIDGGENCWIDDEHGAVPCCNSCDNKKPGECHKCSCWWAEWDLIWAVLSNGETDIICQECHKCSVCDEIMNQIEQANWTDTEEIICDACLPPICKKCKKVFDEEAEAEAEEETEICSACLPKPLVFKNMSRAELQILNNHLIQMEANLD